jgi:hypothetical protein
VGAGLFGRYYVKPTFSAMKDAERLFPKYGDYQEARRHALKLAHWPGGESSGQVMDLDWEWIKGMAAPKAAELRISDTIGGHNNLRIIFYVADVALSNDPLPRIWTIAVLQKKKQRFSDFDLRTFSARLKVLVKRYYPSH